MPEEERPDKTPPEAPAVSRRQFLRGVGVVGAATALAPGLLERGDAAETERDDSHAAVQRRTIRLALNVNGQRRVAVVEPRTTLLNALRNHLDPPVTGPKIVCDRGACGACTVEMDGKTVYACMVLAADAVGRKITTVEGLSASEEHLHPVQAAFVAHDALMCGFCTPGFVMSVKNYLDKNPRATPADVRNACAGNVCRCGTYPRIFEAALDAARQMRGGKEA
ncbi:MAG: (2Fe-2S)-binding protein [Armatimonadetes bacterium]|nr:(2Fe-2S)-binding protein [Armatimonadota bacterium]